MSSPDAPVVATPERELIEALAGRMDAEALALAIGEAYRERLPSFAVLAWDGDDDALLPGIRTGIAEVVELLASGEPDLEAPQARIATHLQLGVTPQDTLAGMGLAGRLIWRTLISAARQDELDALAGVASRLFLYLGGGTEATRPKPDEGRANASRLLIELILSPGSGAERIAQAAEASGARDDRPWRLGVAIAGVGQSNGRLATELLARGYPAAVRGDRVVAVIPDRAPTPLPGAPTLLVVGEPMPLGVMAPTFAVLVMLADVARRRGIAGIVEPADLPLELLLASAPELADRLAHRVLAPLHAHDDARGVDLEHTLRTHLAHDFDFARTAAALHLHPNSLRYRLRRIAELTGLDPARAGDLVVLVLGATAAELEGPQARATLR